MTRDGVGAWIVVLLCGIMVVRRRECGDARVVFFWLWVWSVHWTVIPGVIATVALETLDRSNLSNPTASNATNNTNDTNKASKQVVCDALV